MTAMQQNLHMFFLVAAVTCTIVSLVLSQASQQSVLVVTHVPPAGTHSPPPPISAPQRKPIPQPTAPVVDSVPAELPLDRHSSRALADAKRRGFMDTEGHVKTEMIVSMPEVLPDTQIIVDGWLQRWFGDDPRVRDCVRGWMVTSPVRSALHTCESPLLEGDMDTGDSALQRLAALHDAHDHTTTPVSDNSP